MNVLIIEDEPQAAQRLETLLRDLEPEVNVLAKIDSVKNSVKWFSSNLHPELVFMDIQLADGISFMIFEQCEVNSPVIFTTAYDEYALKAFKVNSIDYILKPVDKDDLSNSIKKFKTLSKSETGNKMLLENIELAMQMLTRKFKSRFMIKVGEHLKTIGIDDILYFYSREKATFCHTSAGRNFILDFTLEQLEEMVDPARFYRINRKYLVRSDGILDIISYTNSRLKLILKGSVDTDIIVARERVQDFKGWLDS